MHGSRTPYGNPKIGKEIKLRIRCPHCNGRGLLWLGGKDYLECPACDEQGFVELWEQYVIAPKHILMPGLKGAGQALVLPGGN